MNTAEEFWANTMPCPPSDCLLWIAGHSRKTGYGRVAWNNKPMDAHRAAFFIANGYWATVTRHTCDVNLCVNPAHLIDGTQKDNIHDCIKRGRFSRGEKHSKAKLATAARGDRNGSRTHPERVARGDRQPHAKLTNAQVLQVKRLIADGYTNTAIGRIYGVSDSYISAIRTGSTWQWLILDNISCQSSE